MRLKRSCVRAAWSLIRRPDCAAKSAETVVPTSAPSAIAAATGNGTMPAKSAVMLIVFIAVLDCIRAVTAHHISP